MWNAPGWVHSRSFPSDLVVQTQLASYYAESYWAITSPRVNVCVNPLLLAAPAPLDRGFQPASLPSTSRRLAGGQQTYISHHHFSLKQKYFFLSFSFYPCLLLLCVPVSSFTLSPALFSGEMTTSFSSTLSSLLRFHMKERKPVTRTMIDPSVHY